MYQRVLRMIGAALIAASLGVTAIPHRAEATTLIAVGYYWVYDPYLCPGSPDTLDRYTRYNDEYGNFVEDLYAGHSTYDCGTDYVMATYEQPYYDCSESTYGCYEIYP